MELAIVISGNHMPGLDDVEDLGLRNQLPQFGKPFIVDPIAAPASNEGGSAVRLLFRIFGSQCESSLSLSCCLRFRQSPSELPYRGRSGL
jgi:hypothetical protein